MQSLFNYNTLNVTLVKSTRTMFIKFNRADKTHAINMEMLFELESLFAWLTNKVEIHSVFITSEDSHNSHFSSGYDLEQVANFTSNQVLKLTDKLQKIVQAMQHLSQTIIVDLRNGASNIACEFAIGADIRVAHDNSFVDFNHNKIGLTPSSSGMSTLALLVGQMHARNFLLTGKKIEASKLVQSGFVFETYSDQNRTTFVSNLLKSIHTQAPVQRIQTKLGIFDRERTNYEQAMKVERQIGKASLMTEDWKSTKLNKDASQEIQDDFMPAKSMSYAAKLSLVKNTPENIEPIN